MSRKKEKYCLNSTCGKELIHTEGRRPKKYCDDKCRVSFYLSQKKEPKYVQKKTFDKLKTDYEELKSKLGVQVQNLTKPTVVEPPKQPKSDFSINTEKSSSKPFMSDAIKKKLGIK